MFVSSARRVAAVEIVRRCFSLNVPDDGRLGNTAGVAYVMLASCPVQCVLSRWQMGRAYRDRGSKAGSHYANIMLASRERDLRDDGASGMRLGWDAVLVNHDPRDVDELANALLGLFRKGEHLD